MKALLDWFRVKKTLPSIPPAMKERERVIDARLEDERKKAVKSAERHFEAARDLERVLSCALRKNGNGDCHDD